MILESRTFWNSFSINEVVYANAYKGENRSVSKETRLCTFYCHASGYLLAKLEPGSKLKVVHSYLMGNDEAFFILPDRW